MMGTGWDTKEAGREIGTEEWELQGTLDYLKDGPYTSDDTWVVYLNGTLTPSGLALLELLEVEQAKRRIEASGCDWWEEHARIEPGPPLSVYGLHSSRRYLLREFGEVGERATLSDWSSAVEYAEAHSNTPGGDE